MKSEQLGLWWWSPWYVFPLLLSSLGLAALSISGESFLQLWRTPKYFAQSDFVLVLLSIVAFLAGTLVAQIRKAPGRPVSGLPLAAVPFLKRAADFSLVLTIGGYLAFLVVAVMRGFSPSILLDILRQKPGAVDIVKSVYFQTVPGITTLTQFGIPAVILCVLLWRTAGWSGARWRLALVVGLGLVRAYFMSERLAVIELILPAFLVFGRLSWVGPVWSRGGRRALLNFMPILGIAALAAGFTIFEIPRSWAAWYSWHGQSLVSFGLERLLGYYVTALNNGALLLRSTTTHPPLPYYTLEWFWSFPVLHQLYDYDTITGGSFAHTYHDLLLARANEEFNNPGGVFLPLLDYGQALGILFWVCIGFVAGRLYAAFRDGSLTGLLLYPMIFLGLAESPRILYWFTGRAFPAWIVLAIVVWRLAGYVNVRSAHGVLRFGPGQEKAA